MALSARGQQLTDLFEQLMKGQISRRQFIARGTALGASMGVLGWLVRAAQTAGAAPHPQDAAVAVPPAAGTEGKTRGQDGELRLLFWQAVTQLSPHVATGTTNVVASQLVVEPLFRLFLDGSIHPNLLAEVPTVANGGLSQDLTQVTLRLQPGVVWSDGTPFTAHDVVFTHQWVTNPNNPTTSAEAWNRIAEITAVDDLTVQVRYERTNFNWYEPFAGQTLGAIYPKHYIEANGNDVMTNAPIGTGPFVVESFAPNDQVLYAVNPNYRHPNKPYFERVNIKGGGDVATAVQLVLVTGDWDYVWNVQLEPELLQEYLAGGQGQYRGRATSVVERINFNFSDPDLEGPDGQRSWYENPHPILSDRAVREAISFAINRELILNQLYNAASDRLTANNITGVPLWDSPNTSWEYNPDRANQILDEAGWVRNGDVREKNGVKLSLDLVTTINSVRQKTQQIVKANLAEVGIEVVLGQVDSGVFFDGSPGNEQNLNHMYHDTNMFSSGAPLSLPVEYLSNWTAGENFKNIAQAANGWNGVNVQRYINPEYDAEWNRLNSGEYTTLEDAALSVIRLNDILWQDVVTVPLVNRAAGSGSYVIHNSLIHGEGPEGEDNYGLQAIDDGAWNIANWNRSFPVDR